MALGLTSGLIAARDEVYMHGLDHSGQQAAVNKILFMLVE